jgi:hypothetical protein
MHAAVTHYHHDGVMTAIGDVAEEDMPWKGSSSKLVEPACNAQGSGACSAEVQGLGDARHGGQSKMHPSGGNAPSW